MNPRQLTAIILAVGISVVTFAFLSQSLPHGTETWLGFGGVYLLAGILLGFPRLIYKADNIPFRYAIVVGAFSALFPVCTRAWSVLTTRPELTLAEVSFILWQPHVLVPFVTAFMAPFAIAKNPGEQFVTSFIIVTPFLIATIRGLLSGYGFGPTFVMLFYGGLLVSGVIAGFPLYLYGRSL